MSPIARFSAVLIVATVVAQTAAVAQGLEVKRYNPSEWTKGRFSEVVTVNGPGKTIYLAGIGAEDENGPAGASAPILHPGSPYEQCRYAYDKIKRLLAAHGASLADAVKQVVYVTDVRFQADVAKCRREAYGDGPIPANTFLVISALAIPGMLLEIDVTAWWASRLRSGILRDRERRPVGGDVKVSVAVPNLNDCRLSTRIARSAGFDLAKRTALPLERRRSHIGNAAAIVPRLAWPCRGRS